LPVNLIVGGDLVAARVEDEVLLQQDDEAVLDLARVEVRGATDGSERLAAVAGEDRVDAGSELAVDVVDEQGAQLGKDLAAVGYGLGVGGDGARGR
jgi:hypothetical protein